MESFSIDQENYRLEEALFYGSYFFSYLHILLSLVRMSFHKGELSELQRYFVVDGFWKYSGNGPACASSGYLFFSSQTVLERR